LVLAMTNPSSSMLGHVELRVRLVYESTGAIDSSDSRSATDARRSRSGTDIPGWELVGLLPEDLSEVPATAQAQLGETPPHGRRCVSDPIALTLDRDEAEGYYLNLTSPQPSLFALMRLPDVASATAAHAPEGVPQAVAVTASYGEGARWMDGGMVVLRTPLPEPMLAWIAEFAQHHFQVEGKKKRGKFRPSFLSRQEFGQVAKAALDEAGQADRAPVGPRPGKSGQDILLGSTGQEVPPGQRRH
jgi:hypothetical protein